MSTSVICASGTPQSYVESRTMDGAFFLGFILILFLIFMAIGKYHPVSGAEILDWKPTRSPEVEAELELDDVDQMLEAQNARRRASGREERTEEDVQMQVHEDRAFIDDYAERVRREDEAKPEDAEDAQAVAARRWLSGAGVVLASQVRKRELKRCGSSMCG